MAMEMSNSKVFEEGWAVLQEAINKVIGSIEEGSVIHFSSEEYMHIYTTGYNTMWSNKFNHVNARKLHDNYKNTFEDYISSKVLPSFQEKTDNQFLHELVKRWNDHKIMSRWLFKSFAYLEVSLPTIKRPMLKETSHLTFYELVYVKMNDRVRDSVISLIDRERDEEQIDQELVKNVLDIYVEMGEGLTKSYQEEFEEDLLQHTRTYYLLKSSTWIMSKSYEDYMLKVSKCLKYEEDRVATYLHRKIKEKLLEVVEHELLKVHAKKLEEMEQEERLHNLNLIN